MKKTKLAAAGFLCLSSATAAGIFDPGMNIPSVRTDYSSPFVGITTPLTWDPMCLDNNRRLGTTLITACVSSNPIEQDAGVTYHSGYFENSNFFSCSQWSGISCVNPSISGNFWKLIMNNEPWWVQNSGPPNQSIPRSLPGAGVMGFAMVMDTPQNEYFYRAHLVNNNIHPNPHPYGQGAIPFLSISIDTEGNGGPIGSIRKNLPKQLYFTSKIWDTLSDDHQHLYNHFMYVMSEWGGKKRGVLVNLYWGAISWGPGLQRNWNWQAKESDMRNGGNLAFFNLGELNSRLCPGLAHLSPITQELIDTSYQIDLSAVFSCASNLGLFDEPMPSDRDLPINEIGFATETTFRNAIWASVHGISLDTPPEYRSGSSRNSPGQYSELLQQVTERIKKNCQTNCTGAPPTRSRLMPTVLRDRVSQRSGT